MTKGQTLFAEAMGALAELQGIEREIQELTGLLETMPHHDPQHGALLDRFGRLQEEFRLKGGYAMEAEVGNVLRGLGFLPSDWERDCGEFSGGWQMRIALAKVLLESADILLLDEPTNYLDIVSIRWLGRFLRGWRGALLLITHDRDFMDSVTTHTMAIHRRRVRKMPGGTEKLSRQILQEEEVHERTRINDERERQEAEAFIARFRAQATKARAVQSRIKALARRERLEKLEEIGARSSTC